ncbi:MAG: septum site-determining protein MinC [Anaerolineales bacterium]|nr:septum site-determining protein MinC [Anaerolineales bacterium]
MPQTIQFKGIREGLLVTLEGEGEWSEVEIGLMDQLSEQGDFLRGAKLILNVENHVINAASMGRLRDQISDMGLTLWAVLTNSPTTEQNAQALGLATKIHQGPVEGRAPRQKKIQDEDEAIFIRRTLRSGASINFDGHVVILGDVNPGAEVIAGGNVLVWGKLRGMVHAGAGGDSEAVVCALVLTPTQLRINDKIAISPSEGRKTQPEMAMVRDGKVVAQPWLEDRKIRKV